ncbi:hypothetical protein FA13DRAFT_1812622 [Coprinellus micaceus]|uniref:Uncharacterized protein n=1 Tax=Coprinellus micaceus TaxID=71717 RepID=A0A4Y7THI3_COPMI|nr:hypothetical protein FA13DRAFT_1812622 [Coprinellus micaceus]
MVEEDKSLKEGVVDYLEGEVTETRTARDTFEFGGLRLTDDDAHMGMEFLLRSCSLRDDHLHERSKKRLTHRVTLGEEVAHDESEGEALDTSGDKRYLHLPVLLPQHSVYGLSDALIAEGIAAPRTSSPRVTHSIPLSAFTNFKFSSKPGWSKRDFDIDSRGFWEAETMDLVNGKEQTESAVIDPTAIKDEENVKVSDVSSQTNSEITGKSPGSSPPI